MNCKNLPFLCSLAEEINNDRDSKQFEKESVNDNRKVHVMNIGDIGVKMLKFSELGDFTLSHFGLIANFFDILLLTFFVFP